MAERKAVTRQMVARYQKGSKRAKGQMLDHLCALTGWNRDPARKALRQALGPPASRRSRTGAVTYGHEVLGPLRKIWAVLDVPAGKRLAPFLGEAMEAMERAGELRLGPEVRGKLLRVSAATHRPAPRSRAPATAGEGALGHQAREPAPGPDPHPHLCRVGRGPPRVPGGRPGGPRRGRSPRRVLPDPHPHRRGHGLDGGPGPAEQRPSGGCTRP
jgi:hypothetical protein